MLFRSGSVNDGQGSDKQARDYARKYPDKFVPFVGMQRGELNDREAMRGPTSAGNRILREAGQKLASGEFFGMGELMLRFYPYTNKFGIKAVSDMDFPVDGWFMRQCADLSARYKAPMIFHAEAEPKVAEAARRLFEAHPQATFVWAHNCGRSSAADIALMLDRYPNLYVDLGGMGYSGAGVEHYGVYWPKRTPWMHLIVDEYGTLTPDMKTLLQHEGSEAVGNSPSEFGAIIRTEVERWKAVSKAAGIKGIQVVASERYARTDSSVTAQVLKQIGRAHV